MTPRCESCGTSWRKHLGIQGTCAKLQEAEQKIERLQAIVDRLPKTADGVPIVPGMEVWSWMGDAGLMSTEITRIGKGGWFAACYSTREAAEKARAK